ncbi:MAG: mechanosensitive ion channel [Gammaproteobacteria bacterium]|nr:mechanosensitive ion channel [Gammaproteobacteria bacterium]
MKLLNFLAEEATEESTAIDFAALWQKVLEWLSEHGVRLVIGLVFLFVGWFIITIVVNMVARKAMKRGKKSPQVIRTIAKIISICLKVLVFIAFMGYVGIETAGIGAIISSLTVAIGLAVQGALSNLAGGIIILFMRPFKIDDFIEAQGVSGTVEIIYLFYTSIRTPDNKLIMIPNGTLANGVITNYSAKPTRRVDIEFSISYKADINKATSIIKEIVDSKELVLKDPEPFVALKALGDSGMTIVSRCWVNSGDYWTIYFALLKEVKERFDKEGIEIPYNQLDVHIRNEEEAK